MFVEVNATAAHQSFSVSLVTYSLFWEAKLPKKVLKLKQLRIEGVSTSAPRIIGEQQQLVGLLRCDQSIDEASGVAEVDVPADTC